MEKIEILQKFLLSLVPEEVEDIGNWPTIYQPTENEIAGVGFNAARGKMIKNIKEADIEKLLHLLQ